MWKILQQNKAEDFVVATGESKSLHDFLEITFGYLGLKWEKHVVINQKLKRASDIQTSKGCANKAKDILKWEAKTKLPSIIKQMITTKNTSNN
jgi:GDPmannose 4,6-dehydratase